MKPISKTRVGHETISHVEQFIAQMEPFLDRVAGVLVNYDETRLVLDGNRVVQRRFARSSARADVQASRNLVLGSVLCFVTALGENFLAVYNLKAPMKGDTLLVNAKVPASQPERGAARHRIFMHSECGYFDKSSMEHAMTMFSKFWCAAYPGLNCVLIGDQLAAHKQTHVIKALADKRIFCCLMPTNTSHFLQPLDNMPFAALKKAWTATTESISFAAAVGAQKLASGDLLPLAIASESAMTSAVIKAGFRNTGLCPWNPKLIRKLAANNVGRFDLPIEPTAVELCASAASAVISAHQTNMRDSVERHQRVKAKVQRNTSFTTDELLALGEKVESEAAEKKRRADDAAVEKADKKRAKLANKEARTKQKAVDDENKTCTGCTAKHYGGKGWLVCKHCELSYACPKCRTDQLDEFRTHQTLCGTGKLNDSDTD